jgi:hypothetical protein
MVTGHVLNVDTGVNAADILSLRIVTAMLVHALISDQKRESPKVDCVSRARVSAAGALLCRSRVLDVGSARDRPRATRRGGGPAGPSESPETGRKPPFYDPLDVRLGVSSNFAG